MCEIIEFEGKMLKAVPTDGFDRCNVCFFNDCSLSVCENITCGEWEREDKQDVIFVEIVNV